jgi:hypothetical protein
MRTPQCPSCVDYSKAKRACIHLTLWGNEPEVAKDKCGNFLERGQAAEVLGRETE